VKQAGELETEQVRGQRDERHLDSQSDRIRVEQEHAVPYRAADARPCSAMVGASGGRVSGDPFRGRALGARQYASGSIGSLTPSTRPGTWSGQASAKPRYSSRTSATQTRLGRKTAAMVAVMLPSHSRAMSKRPHSGFRLSSSGTTSAVSTASVEAPRSETETCDFFIAIESLLPSRRSTQSCQTAAPRSGSPFPQAASRRSIARCRVPRRGGGSGSRGRRKLCTWSQGNLARREHELFFDQ